MPPTLCSTSSSDIICFCASWLMSNGITCTHHATQMFNHRYKYHRTVWLMSNGITCTHHATQMFNHRYKHHRTVLHLNCAAIHSHSQGKRSNNWTKQCLARRSNYTPDYITSSKNAAVYHNICMHCYNNSVNVLHGSHRASCITRQHSRLPLTVVQEVSY